MIETEGRLRLAEKATNQTAVAALLGVTPSSVSNWIRGVYRPEAEMRSRIAVVLGIAESAWLTAEERAAISGAAERAAKPGRHGEAE